MWPRQDPSRRGEHRHGNPRRRRSPALGIEGLEARTLLSAPASIHLATGALPLFNPTDTADPTSTTVTVSTGSAVPGQPVTLTATVTDHDGIIPTGTVTFFDGGTILGTAPLVGPGVATLTTTSLALGADPIEARYSGDTNFAGSTSPRAPIVNVAMDGGNVSLRWTWRRDNRNMWSIVVHIHVGATHPGAGTPTPTGSITVERLRRNDRVKAIATVTLTDGEAVWWINTHRGRYAFRFQYDGDADFLPSYRDTGQFTFT
jgi:hypothetical protein